MYTFNRLLFFCLLISSPLAAQSIRGKITNAQSEPLPGITVRVANPALGTQTDANGEYALALSGPGTYRIKATGVGYDAYSREVLVKDAPLLLNITLAESAEQLQTIEVVGRKETDYKNAVSFIGTKSATLLKDVPQSISYVTKELMLDQAAFRVNDVVKNMSGVNQFSFYNDITIRGHRVQGQQNSSILINGQRALTSFWKQQLIPHMERVEVIKGPASAMFGNASAGGTINRVTKKPLDEKYQSISTTFGSFETFRALADFTGPLNEDKTVLYRLNAGYENSGSFRNLQYDKNLIVAPSISFVPNDKTRINADLVIQRSDT
ncbi:TonB-dependent receptor plug domain-containing protein, partial [Persicitalea sp.]|uniref:TonB-dependent receptor plug domain-containing protein n=1 Tax=Persicitalea sp. TaxID=3100273 RepID=UPI00359343E9